MAPKDLHPYIKLGRFDRPIGVWLLVMPALWAIMLAIGGLENMSWEIAKIFAYFIIGAFAARGAGCTINDIWDRKYDAQVERTKNRPLACGELNLRQAFVFLYGLLGISFCILMQFNQFTIMLGACSLIPIAIYPLMKRITFWPQLFLGFTMNLSALIGWAAMTGNLHPPAYILYVGAIFWTLGYDTIYAHQDKADDVKAGIKSTARKLGERTQRFVFIFYLIAFTGFLFAKISTALPQLISLEQSIPFLLVLGHFSWQCLSLKCDDPKDCLAKFKSNKFLGFLVLYAFAV